MKKLHIFALVVFIFLFASASIIFADEATTLPEETADFEENKISGICGDNMTWELDENGVLTFSGSGIMYDYMYSSQAPWVEYGPLVKEIVFSEDVTNIGRFAFYNFTALTEFTVPDNITTIGQACFNSCTSLKTVTFSDNVTSMGTFVFENCTSLEKADLGNGMKTIPAYTFQGCTSLTDVTASKDITLIDDYAFYGCTALVNYNFYEGLNEIGDFASYNCKLLNSIDLPSTLKKLGKNSFGKCNSLVEVEFPESMTSIPSGSFSNCSNLQKVKLPDTITNIGIGAFSYSSHIEEINLPDGLKYISESAFRGCSRIKKLIIPNSVVSIGMYAFQNCSNLERIVLSENITIINQCVFEQCTSLKSIIIPAKVATINTQAFYKCSSLEYVKINGSSLTYINNNAFGECKAIKYVNIPQSLVKTGMAIFNKSTSNTNIFIEATAIPESWDQNWNYQSNANVHLGSIWTYSRDEHIHTCIDENCKITDCHVMNEYDECIVCPYTLTGFYTENGKLYYQIDGVTVSGWFTVDGKVYYASNATNVVINYSKKIQGKYYIWNDEIGLVIADGFVFDGTGYKCYEDGVNVIGWRHVDGSGPKVVNGISEQYSSNPEGLYYFLSTTGYMITEPTYKLGGYIREFNDDHTVKAMNGLQTNAGELYYYVDGVKQTGWHTINGTTYYFRASDAVYGRAATKWMYISNKVYYFYASTSATPYALKDSGSIGGITYTYHEDGYILYNGFVNCDYANVANSNTAINIQKKNATTRYYVNGEMQTGWQEIDGKMYYFYAIGSSMGSGYMCVESRTIGGVFYEFSEDGNCYNYLCVKNGHDWVEANCTTPKTCSRCSVTEGDIQHTIVNNKCTVCGYLKPSEGLEYEYLSYYKCYRVKSIGTCQDTNIVIPDTYNDKPVVSIGVQSFKNQTQIQSVVIPEGITSIGNYAFSDCSNLISISIPNSLLTIDYYAFFRCYSLKNIELPGVVYIESDAFRGCTSLESITIPNTLQRVGQNAFQSCSMLNSVYINDIAAWCNIDFYDPTSNPLSNHGNLYLDGELITDLIIPSNVKIIKKYSFCISENINSVIIPSGLKIELFAFIDSKIKIIYCEADSKPDEWSSLWNDRCNAVVYWGNQWEYVDGVPTVIQ